MRLCAGATAGPAQETQPVWLEPTKAEPAGTKYQTFRSKTIDAEVSYLVYLPPDYANSGEKRYPIVYWLHGLGGDQRRGAAFVQRLDTAIKAGKAPSMIAILVNGQRDSFYCDSVDGKMPVESVIIKDLLPHVDATYRTIRRREARGVEGMSMGGYGAAHLGFKYPELFGAVSMLAAALIDAGGVQARPGSLLQRIHGGRQEIYDANSPWTVIEKHAEAIRGKTRVRMWVGDQDQLLGVNQRYHALLQRLNIEHEYEVMPGIGHAYPPLYEKMGERAFAFYSAAFSDLEATR
jgi:endo-1,4-beta-xylanase